MAPILSVLNMSTKHHILSAIGIGRFIIDDQRTAGTEHSYQQNLMQTQDHHYPAMTYLQ